MSDMVMAKVLLGTMYISLDTLYFTIVVWLSLLGCVSCNVNNNNNNSL